MTPLEWRAVQQVNTTDTDGTHDDQFDPQIVQLENGNVLVVWVSNSDPASGPGSAFANDLIGRIFDPLGNPITGEIEINTNWKGDTEAFPAVTALEGGGFMVAYKDFRASLASPNWAIRAEVFDNNGSNLRDITIVAPDSVNEWSDPEIASISATNALITYTDGGAIFGQVINPATGAIINSQFTVAPLANGDFQGVDVTALTTDFYLITYADRDAGNDELHFRLYNTVSDSLGTQQTIAGNFADIENPSVAALDNGGFVITWQVDGSGGSNIGIRAAVYNSFAANTVSEFNPLTTLAGNQTHPEVVALDNNEFVIAWVDENLNDIKGQRYDVNGVKIGSEFTIIDHTTFIPGPFSMTRLEDGRFQVAWERSAGTDADVFTSIWDPRAGANDTVFYPDNMIIGTPDNDSINPIPAGADEVYGADGNDTFWVTAADVGGTLFDGGNGADTLGILDTSGGLFGILGLLGTTLNSVEVLKFNAGGGDGLKSVLMDGVIANTFTTFDFAQGGATRADELLIHLNTLTTFDMAGANIVDFESLHDLIFISGDSSAETITGSSVNDTIDGGNGLDTLDGGGGFDTLSLVSGGYVGTVTTNLINETVTSSQGVETIISFENVQGSSAEDIVFGTDAHANIIRGGDGDDFITGKDLADQLFGEAGDDDFHIRFSGDIDDGVETIDGGSGMDTIIVGLGATVSQVYNLRNENISSIEQIDFVGQLGGSSTDDRVELTARQFNLGDVSLTANIDGHNLAGSDETLEVFMTSESTLDLSGLTFSNWGGQNDLVRITGDNTGETITGSSQNDEINASSGDDTVFGGAGNDIIDGGAGADNINGGAGEDTLDGGSGVNDTVNYLGNNDAFDVNMVTGVTSFVGETATNFENIDVGNGNNLITGTAGDNIINTNGGSDTIEGGDGDDVIDGGSGSDTASYENAASGITQYLQIIGVDTGGAGTDTLNSIENLTGSAFVDRLIGDSNDNVLTGGGSDDILKGRGGNDDFFGGAGNDKLTGDTGVDTMSGGSGIDTLFGLAGIDTLNGGADTDHLFGGRDDDVLNGDDGIDDLHGNRGIDILNGGGDSDDLRGGGQNDTLNGDEGNDFLFGENHSDFLYGGSGNDSLTGGVGGGAFDGFTDTFIYRDTGDGGGGFDRIKDFENGIDVMDLSSFGFANFAAVQALASDTASGLRIDFGGGDVLFVENFLLANFDAGDVLI